MCLNSLFDPSRPAPAVGSPEVAAVLVLTRGARETIVIGNRAAEVKVLSIDQTTGIVRLRVDVATGLSVTTERQKEATR